MIRLFPIVVLCVSSLIAAESVAQSLYKYKGPDGEWVYTDREPEAAIETEERELARGSSEPTLRVFHREAEDDVALYAQNEFYAPVQVVLGLEDLQGFEPLPADQSLRFVVPARGEVYLMSLVALTGAQQTRFSYQYRYLLGDPAAEHRPTSAYRAPFAAAGGYPISQAYPYAITHTTPDSRYAVDIAMPIGTDVYAARGGTVIDVASTNFRSGTDPNDSSAQANVIRILHDDGTYAIYAHLNWNSIRVRPGEIVTRGQYIADSGNTGFSTGPHLHFAVVKNADLRNESVPVTFDGPDGGQIVPRMGETLTAY